MRPKIQGGMQERSEPKAAISLSHSGEIWNQPICFPKLALLLIGPLHHSCTSFFIPYLKGWRYHIVKFPAAHFVNANLFPSDHEALFTFSWRRNHLLDDLFPPEQTLPITYSLLHYPSTIHCFYKYTTSSEDHKFTLALWCISQKHIDGRKFPYTETSVSKSSCYCCSLWLDLVIVSHAWASHIFDWPST